MAAPLSPLAALVEALLFAAAEPVGLGRLAELAQTGETEVKAALRELGLALSGHGIEVCSVAGGYRLFTRPEYAASVAALVQPQRMELSPAALEALAIVAFRQPVTRAEVDELRGVHSESTLATLLERGLIRETGRVDAPGRPILYGTTRRFLERFGLRNLTDLKTLDLLRPGSDAAAPADATSPAPREESTLSGGHALDLPPG